MNPVRTEIQDGVMTVTLADVENRNALGGALVGGLRDALAQANADPAVRRDFESHFQRLVPEDPSLYEHLDEGIDDAASHLKASLLGATLSLPVSEGRLALGTWQGIYLCEHRHRAAGRQLVATVLGE